MTSEAIWTEQMRAFEAAWQQRNFAAAALCLHSLQALNPHHHWTYFAQGMYARLQEDSSQARACFQAAVRAAPHFWEAWLELGQQQYQAGELSAAIHSLSQVCQLRPDCLKAWEHLIRCLVLRGDHPSLQAVLNDLLHPAWPASLPLQTYFDSQRYHRFHPVWASFFLLSRFAEPHCPQSEINALLARWAHVFPPSQTPYVHVPDRDSERLLRIGWVSREWFTPVSQRMFWPLLAAYDAAAYQVVIYADDDQPGEMPKGFGDVDLRLSQAWDTGRFCQQVRTDAIDILVDLSGQINPLRLDAFRCRPAPIQLTAATNPPFSTGIPEIGWRWSDSYLTPPAWQLGFLEQTLYLDSFFCWQPPADSPAVPPQPCLTRGHLRLGALASANKINTGVLKLWGQLLQLLPEAELYLKSPLYRDPLAREASLQALAQSGCRRTQVHFETDTLNVQSQLSFLSHCDLILDTFPYAGALSTCDAFWMGVPVLSLQDERRLAQSIHRHVGTAEAWLAETPEQWLKQGLKAAQNPHYLAHWRQKLRPLLLASPLGQIERHAQQQQASYRQLWRQWCQSDYNKEHAD